jgi:hypothetical protein
MMFLVRRQTLQAEGILRPKCPEVKKSLSHSKY